MSRILAVLLSIACCGTAFADTVTIQSLTSRSAVDGGTGDPPDGQFDQILEGDEVVVANRGGTDPYVIGGIYEFVLPEAVMQPGTAINQVIITIPIVSEQSAGSRIVEVTGYQRNVADEITLAQFATKGQVSYMQASQGWPTAELYVPYFLQVFPGSADARFGLVLSSADPGTELLYGAGATIFIDYTPPQGDAPSLTINSPDDGTTYFEGENIPFSASVWDTEDLNSREWAIEWQSSIIGFFGWGPYVSQPLPVGTHLVQATHRDSNQNVVARARTVTVLPISNSAPTVSITSPEDGARLLIRDPAPRFTATASDAEQGSMDAVIEWWLDDMHRIGTGPELRTILPWGPHTLTAQVTDALGATSKSTIHVEFEEPPEYCPARGISTSREYIRLVNVNQHSSQTNSNNGYALLDYPVFRAQAGMPGSISLAPRFISGTSVVHWGVWADLNRDSLFTPDELLASGSGTGQIGRGFTIPATTANGATRLRVVMKQGSPAGACGNFPRGEVEDYTLEITGGVDPAPATAYCTARGLDSSRWISDVRRGSQTYVSGDDHGYRDFTEAPSFGFTPNVNYPFAFRASGPAGGIYSAWAVWIDINQDFEFSASERVTIGFNTSGLNDDIYLPPTALPGRTRMRVLTNASYGNVVSPCEVFELGEVEDFTVIIGQ